MTQALAATTPKPGDMIASKYRVDRELGQGGMGVVVAATHIDLHEARAIKLMRASQLSTPKTIERFFQEARALIKLRSQHVVEVYDVGRLKCGTPYLVMEQLEGEDIANALARRGTFPISEAVRIALQAANALAEAHALGIIHRDLKPSNLFLARQSDGRTLVKVIDFGISKHTLDIDHDFKTTDASEVLGSPLYMAPEQLCSAPSVDGRADIWSIGAILYQLLTRRSPFQGITAPELFSAVLAPISVPAPSSYRKEIPEALDSIVLRCLEKERIHRYARVDDLIADLSALLASIEMEKSTRASLVDSLFPSTNMPPTPSAEPKAPRARLSRVMLAMSATVVALSLVALFLSITSPWEPNVEVLAKSARPEAPQPSTQEARSPTNEDAHSADGSAKTTSTRTSTVPWESSIKSAIANAPNAAGQTHRPRVRNEASR